MSETLTEYYVGPVKIKIIKDESGICKYIVEEPSLTKYEENIKNNILSDLLYINTKNLEDEVINRLKEKGFKDESIEKILYHIKKSMLYDIITPLMLDQQIEEIECKGYGYPITVVHRDFSECIRLYTNIIPQNDEEVVKVIEKLANKANKSINIAKPYVEFSLPDGDRVAATLNNEISLPGSTFDIRKFPSKPLSIINMVDNGMLNEIIASYLWFLIEYKPFIMILGPTGSGKTTLLTALLNLINPNYKILTIEDTPEINIVSDNWVRFISRSTLASDYDVTLNDLAKLALRYRPDYLVVGEVRGKEIEALIHASASGHGSLTTFHGSRPIDAVTRITDLLSTDLSKLFLQTIWSFVVVSRRKEGRKSVRSIISIYETNIDKGKIKFKKIIEWSFNKGQFIPNDVNSLIKKSYRLKWIGKTYGLSQDEIKEELSNRIEFLKKLRNDRVVDFYEVSNKIRKYYDEVIRNAKSLILS
ncbi:type II/IV secretion system ATPase subunit [Sulfurisphaera javensis]|uniref:Type II/IV secretion system ATPase subunit n=1 Tax=Sulfurisphaera javensis TaxID=2049879 RepID=A0AAT9GU54_9CREN